MTAVSDTGPLIGLAKANRLLLLKNLFEKVLIPPMVRKKLFAKTGDEGEFIDNALMDFIQISEINPIDETAKLIIEGFGEGERQAIGVAVSMGNDAILLIDDLAENKLLKSSISRLPDWSEFCYWQKRED